MTPQAPWTIICIRNAPTVISARPGAKANSGETTSAAAAQRMIVRRRPNPCESAPKYAPPMIAPML